MNQKMLRKRIAAGLTASLLCLTFSACSMEPSVGGGSADAPESGDTIKLGFVAMDLANQVFVQTIEGAQAFADEHGYELNVVDGASSAEKQVSGMENLVAMGCTAIDCRAIDGLALADAVQNAEAKGVAVNTYPDIEGRTAVLKYDDYDQGVKLAEAAAEWINDKLGGTAEVALLTQPAVDAVMERVDGFKDVLAEKCPNATIVAEEEGHETDTGMSVTESILQAHPDVKVILCVNDSGALGAYEALQSSGKNLDDMFLGGIDGTDAALEKIQEGGVYRATVAGAWMFQEIGYACMQNITNAALGEDYEEIFTVEVMAITQDNVKDYLAKTPDYTQFQ